MRLLARPFKLTPGGAGCKNEAGGEARELFPFKLANWGPCCYLRPETNLVDGRLAGDLLKINQAGPLFVWSSPPLGIRQMSRCAHLPCNKNGVALPDCRIDTAHGRLDNSWWTAVAVAIGRFGRFGVDA